MNQQTLDFTRPLYRASNPRSSAIAADVVTPHLNDRRKLVLEILRQMGQATSKEISIRTPHSSAEVGRRLSDLENLGLARPLLKDGVEVIKNRFQVWEAV